MERLIFNCQLLTDLVLTSRSATAGFHASLDYIPGAKFLGLVAGQLYDSDQSDASLDLFHNGTVRFGDAHPLLDSRALRVPAAWAYAKMGGLTEEIYLYSNLTDEDVKELSGKGIQLKQAKGAFFTQDGALVSVEQNFSIKSAYDRSKRRSAESQMFGYFALQRGSMWQFYVDVDNGVYADRIISALKGERRIGRSTSAQYGLVNIEFKGKVSVEHKPLDPGRLFLYAESNLCFYDEIGNPTLRPDAKLLKLPLGSRIIWEECQIRTRRYQTWNKKRKNRNADRLIIVKGSVFVVELSESTSTAVWQEGIGAHRAEGFGQVMANPSFLISETKQLENLQLTSVQINRHLDDWSPRTTKGEQDDTILSFLERKLQGAERSQNIDQQVNDFMQRNQQIYKGVSASQWGQVRNITKKAADLFVLRPLLFDPQMGLFHYGQSEQVWRKFGRAKRLEEYLFPAGQQEKANGYEFLMKLASEMAKIS